MKLKLLLLGFLVTVVTAIGWSQTKITGKITDESTGESLIGASVVAKGTTVGTVTDVDGSFSFDAPANTSALVISYVGYTAQEVAVVAGQTVYGVKMAASNILTETVIVGYGSQIKTRVVGSVSRISNRAIREVGFGSLDNALQGQATGVQVTAQSGRPGAPAFIRIRGVGSISASRDPLYVVDGVPVTTDFYNLINSNDIDEISILKDAASAAIYGSRGSNGVVLVTTLKGSRSGKPQVTFSYLQGVKNKTPDNFRLMNQQEKLQYEYDLGFTNQPLIDSTKVLFPGKSYRTLSEADRQTVSNSLSYTDWQKLLFRDAQFKSYDFSVSGGDDKFNYYFSLQNYDETGTSIGSIYNRKGGRLNLEYNPTNWLRVGTFSTLAVTNEDLIRDRNNVQGTVRAAYTYNTYEPVLLSNGSYNLTHQGFSVSEAILNNPENTTTIGGITTFYVEASPVNSLKFRSTVGLNLRDFTRESYLKPGSILDNIVGDANAPGNKTDNGLRDYNYVFTNTAQYSKDFKKLHHVDAIVGVEYTFDNLKTYSLQSKGYPSALVNTQNNGAAPVSVTSTKTDYSLYSVFGRATYNYDDKYTLEGSLRSDGSSRLGVDSRYGVFGAVGAAWNLARESFFKNALSFADVFKLRGSIGTSGNTNFGTAIGNYPSLGLYALNASYNGLPAEVPQQVTNANLTWEKNLNWGVGIEVEAFNSRFRGIIEYYNKKTFDLIFNQPISQSTGFSTTLKNIGDMQNKGVEIFLDYDIIKNVKNDFRWTVKLSYSNNSNQITKLFGGKEVDAAGGVSRYKEGYPIDVFYLSKWAGVNPDNGSAQWYDKDGKIVQTFNAGNAVILDGKAPDPTFFGNFKSVFSFKGLELSSDFYYSGGNYIYNLQYRTLFSDGANGRSAQTADALNYWRNPGDVGVSPKPVLSGGQTSWDSDRFLQKGDYIRLRNVKLSYSLNKDWLKGLLIQKAGVFVQGQNLATWTAYKGDPEVGYGSGENGVAGTRGGLYSLFSYPASISVSAGANITF